MIINTHYYCNNIEISDTEFLKEMIDAFNYKDNDIISNIRKFYNILDLSIRNKFFLEYKDFYNDDISKNIISIFKVYPAYKDNTHKEIHVYCNIKTNRFYFIINKINDNNTIASYKLEYLYDYDDDTNIYDLSIEYIKYLYQILENTHFKIVHNRFIINNYKKYIENE